MLLMSVVGKENKMERVLILDDDEIRHVGFKKKFKNVEIVSVYTAKDAIKEVKKGNWDWIFLDHDLGGMQMVESGEETGWEVADFISRNPELAPKIKIVLHSLNPAGRKNMKNVLRRLDVETVEAPFAWM